MKKTLRERAINRLMNETSGFTYNKLAKMDSESRFEAILKYIKTLDSKNKSHQIILGEIASALRGFYPKYAFKEVQVIADLAAKGFIPKSMEQKLASHLPMNENTLMIEGRDKSLVKAVNLLYDVSDLIKDARLNDLDDDSDRFYVRANEELYKLVNTLRYINN